MNRLEAAGNMPENQNPVRQSAIEKARQILQDAEVKDPGMPVATSIEVKPIPQEFRPFTAQEEEALRKDGAHFI